MLALCEETGLVALLVEVDYSLLGVLGGEVCFVEQKDTTLLSDHGIQLRIGGGERQLHPPPTTTASQCGLDSAAWVLCELCRYCVS